MTFVVENSGAGGYFSHVGRIAVFGRPPTQVRAERPFVLEAQRLCVERLVPGAQPAEIIAVYDEHMRAHDRPEENRLLGHGQGYDVVERPLIRADETLPIAAGMHIGVHPMYTRQRVFAYGCDDYLIDAAGATRINAFPQELVEL